MADNVLHPLTGTGTASVTQRTKDLGASGHVPYVIICDSVGDSAMADAFNALNVVLVSSVTVTMQGQAQHDSVYDTPQYLVPISGRASAAAPADVSADGDHVSAWRLRNGAGAVVVTAAGALIGGDATNGLDVDVTRLPALVAGTANIGDVDVLTLPGTFAEDATPSGGDLGMSVLAVRRDAPASSSGTDGDWSTPGVDSLGRLWVAPNPRILTAITPTIDTALYAAADRLGSVMTFTGAALANGGAGKIVNAVLTSRDTEAPVIELWLFQVSPTMANADNGVFDLTDANLEAGILLGVIEFVSYYKTGAGEVSIGQMRGAALGGPPLPYKCGAAATAIYGIMCIRSASTYGTTTDLVVTLTMDRE